MRKLLLIIFQLLFIGFANSQVQKIISYQYWFDSNFSSKTDSTIAVPAVNYNLQALIPTNGLSIGLHTFHLRFKSDSNLWSSVLSQFFQKLPSTSPLTNKISSYEYWVDNNYAGKVLIAVGPAENYQLIDSILMSSLTNGLHTFHIRFKDEAGQWSSVLSQFFQKIPAGTTVDAKMTAYEYWIDNNYAGKVFAGVSPSQNYQLLDSLPFASISNGLHTIHMRFKDQKGQWSSVLSQFFQKLPLGATADAKIMAYEYWIDNNYSGKVSANVTPSQNFQLLDSLPFTSASVGLHTLHIRFKDQKQQWSSVLSQFFQKLPNTLCVPNLITAYKYWVDISDSTMRTVYLAVPTNPYNLLSDLDLKHIPKGNHTINFQFKDTLGLWSSVLTDTIYKFPTPTANFIADKYLLCDSGLITFTNQSFDADTFKWDFDDGHTSNLINPTHYFTSPGLYHVKLVAYDTTETVKDSITHDIRIDASPIVNLGNDVSLCQGNSIVLDAGNAGCTYSWSTGETISAITVSTTNVFSVTATTQYGCTDRDTINVTVNPLPNVTATGNTICIGATTYITGSGANTYTWSTTQTGSSVSVNPTVTTTYYVTGTDNNGCTNTAQTVVNVNSLPTITATGGIICTGNCLNISASGGITYTWSNTDTGSNISVCPTTTTTYTVTGNDLNACTNTATAVVTVDPKPNVTANGATICIDASTYITCSGATTYTWNTTQTGSSVSVNPTVNTTYYVTGTDNNGCTNTAQAVVYVNPLPLITAAGNTICTGSCTNIVASGGSTYTWNTTQTGSNISACPTTTTTYTVTGTDLNACTNTATAVITVNPKPNVTATGSTICVGNAAVICSSGATTFTWSIGSTGSCITVAPTITTTYIVTGTDVNGCTNSATTVVTVNQKPTITASGGPVCNGNCLNIIASGGVTYTWNTMATGSSISVCPTMSMTYTVTGMDPNTCTNTATAIVMVNPKPNVSFSGLDTVYCHNILPVTLTGSPVGGTFSGPGISGNVFTPSLSIVGFDTVAYSYTDGNGCSNIYKKMVHVKNCMGINEKISFAENISIYPNPFNDNLNIGFNLIKPANITIRVLNLLGQELFVVINEKRNKGQQTIILNSNNLREGTYYLQIQTDEESIVKEIVLIR
ncbi:MAG: PKD domain-containing protein [Bacteroidales bacterium]|nr:PKD domain-containing protein [Bacteroidales bacterium]